MNKNCLIALCSLFLVAACGPTDYEPSDYKPTPKFKYPEFYVPEIDLSGLGILNFCNKTSEETQPSFALSSQDSFDIEIRVISQQVLRLDCQGEVKSDKIQTIIKNNSIELNFTKSAEHPQLQGMSIHNPRSCETRMEKLQERNMESWPGIYPITFNKLGQVKLFFDPTLKSKISFGNLKIYEGLNYFDMKAIGECDVFDQNPTDPSNPQCEKYKIIETKSIKVDVIIKKEVMDEKITIKATSEECSNS